MTGVSKFSPISIVVPPVEAVYQFRVPVLAVACKVTVPVSLLVAPVVLVTTGIGFTVAKTGKVGKTQPPLTADT